MAFEASLLNMLSNVEEEHPGQPPIGFGTPIGMADERNPGVMELLPVRPGEARPWPGDGAGSQEIGEILFDPRNILGGRAGQPAAGPLSGLWTQPGAGHWKVGGLMDRMVPNIAARQRMLGGNAPLFPALREGLVGVPGLDIFQGDSGRDEAAPEPETAGPLGWGDSSARYLSQDGEAGAEPSAGGSSGQPDWVAPVAQALPDPAAPAPQGTDAPGDAGAQAGIGDNRALWDKVKGFETYTPEERAKSRVDYAWKQLDQNPTAWEMTTDGLGRPHWKCNEFVGDAHAQGDPLGWQYPREESYGGLYTQAKRWWNGESGPAHYYPTVKNLADPNYRPDALEYIGNDKDVRPGDIVVWRGGENNRHHTGIAIDDEHVIAAGQKELGIVRREDMFPEVTPIIRRVK
ncbi:DUF1287 domain-containing protein [Fundidesulfovibrio soli]|uniref:DUF1287 domain-containing protein n=1 Tax=Fundidesulfovibrio soli TaxID=2922716 RepID=UPI001FAEC1AB|nr:DUF1287 domain-containing protein [Fundidesulfovibrio soli]